MQRAISEVDESYFRNSSFINARWVNEESSSVCTKQTISYLNLYVAKGCLLH